MIQTRPVRGKFFLATTLVTLALSSWSYAEDSETPLRQPAAVDRAAALRELKDFSLAGMDRRLGPKYASLTQLEAQQRFPEIWMHPSKQETGGRRYQIGGPWTKEGGDFSSTQGQILYVPDNGPGVDRVTILEWSNGCFSERPEAPWWGGFRPEPTYEKWKTAAGGNPGTPIAMARGMGSWANCGVIVFSSGLVATAGTCTGHGSDPTFQFPPGKLPTAVSVTNKNEFALVTVVDTEQKKGQVAVLALESSGKVSGFAHEWRDDHPCLPNVAVFTKIKLLGYIDLPGIEFPTGVCGVGNREGGRVNGLDGNAGILRVFDLGQQSARDMFLKGGNVDYTSTAGFAVAISKYEGKAAFIDLQPLFERVRNFYFTTEENYRKTRDSGLEPAKWPYAFDVDPSWKPPVVKVIDVPQPTAVIASMSGGKNARALIASLDGKVGVYEVGGLATESPASAEDIRRVGEVQVGRNPVCLAYQKYASNTIMAVSRGDREIAWIKYSEKSAEVVRRLRDSRLIDPVNVESADTHGIETPLITVADFKGRKIVNYRYGTLVFATQGGAKFGMGPEGKDEFECGGIMEFPGSPLCVSASNVN
ncbi:MAG: hypothetical protein JWP03_1256 [Phycisphaerales bacterium]|nr:hypothetical protein [Phycisphaerales bacterium]